MIGKWVAQALDHGGISQAELSRQLHQRFGWPDDRSLVNKIIKGRRDLSASEMMHISEITGLPIPSEDAAARSVALMGYIGAGAEILPDFEQLPHEGLDQIEVPFPLPDEMIAFEVRGDSMLPVYKDGHIVICYKDQKRPIEAFFGEDAAVRTTDGRRFIKTVMRGSPGVTLVSWNAAPIENIGLEWIGEIFATLPRSSIRKVERVGGIQGRLRLSS